MNLGKVKIFFDERNINFFAWSGVYQGFLFSSYVKRFVGDKLSGCVTRIENDHGHWGVDLKKWHELGKKVQIKLAAEKLDAQANVKKLEEVGTRLMKYADEIIGKNLNNVTNKSLAQWFKKSWRDNLDLNGIGFLGVISDFEHNYLSSDLLAILEKYSSDSYSTQKSLAILMSANKPDLNWYELRELFKIIRKYKTVSKITASKEFQSHINKYNWLNFGFQGPIWTEKDFIERVKKILSDGSVEKQYLGHLNYFPNLRKEQADLEKELGLSRHERYLFEYARLMMYTKAFRVNARHKIQYAFELAFKEQGKRFFQPVYFFRYSRVQEIIALLEGKPVDTAAILKRRSLMLEITEKGKQRFILGKDIDKVYQKLLVKETQIQADAVQGQSAYAGVVRGKVKLVFGLEDLTKVKKGDILVAISTTPDLLPAMVRARAFVTDQGGITSHAAIVAREFKKPCIIGTRHATKVFKDGDRVEVDANKGIVRKIK